MQEVTTGYYFHVIRLHHHGSLTIPYIFYAHRDHRDDLYPIRYGAAVLFSDGSVEVAWMKKGLEYGTTLDAVTQVGGEGKEETVRMTPCTMMMMMVSCVMGVFVCMGTP